MKVRVIPFGVLKEWLGAGAIRRARSLAERDEVETRRRCFATPARSLTLLRRFAWPVLLALTPLAAAAQETTLHMNVKLVSVFVNVTDQNGAIVSGLTRNDFALFEDGRPQKIAIFEKQSALPLNLVLAIDTSGSVQKDMRSEAEAARRFARAILRPQDQMSVFQFATDVRQLTPFTNNLKVVERGLNDLRGGFATAFYEALCMGSESLGRKQGRKVLVVISDGDDTADIATYPQALEAALRNNVMIYSLIVVPIEASAGRDTGGEHALITLAEQTGGKYFYVNHGGLDVAFQRIGEDLRTQYLLGYYPQHELPGVDFHRIQVTIPRAAPGAFQLSYRTGYYSNSPVRSSDAGSENVVR